MATSTLTSKGQVTIPKTIRDRLGLVEGEVLEFTVDEEGCLVVRRQKPKGAFGILRDYAPPQPVSVDKMKASLRSRALAKARR